jgi:hypothetical protein
MQKKLLYLMLLFLSFNGFAQEDQPLDSLGPEINLQGQIVSFEDKTPLSGAHLFNLNSVLGSVANDFGRFEIPTRANDTIYISYIGYQSIKLKITNDLLKGNELVIELHEKREEIN